MYSFKKQERLCSLNLFKDLLANGDSFFIYPFKCVWIENINQSLPLVQIAFAIPKKKIRFAVNRNTIRRRTKEAYRLNKQQLLKHLQENNKHLSILLIYAEKAEIDYCEIENKIILILQRLINNVN